MQVVLFVPSEWELCEAVSSCVVVARAAAVAPAGGQRVGCWCDNPAARGWCMVRYHICCSERLCLLRGLVLSHSQHAHPSFVIRPHSPTHTHLHTLTMSGPDPGSAEIERRVRGRLRLFLTPLKFHGTDEHAHTYPDEFLGTHTHTQHILTHTHTCGMSGVPNTASKVSCCVHVRTRARVCV